jgi:hypothetical protein
MRLHSGPLRRRRTAPAGFARGGMAPSISRITRPGSRRLKMQGGCRSQLPHYHILTEVESSMRLYSGPPQKKEHGPRFSFNDEKEQKAYKNTRADGSRQLIF